MLWNPECLGSDHAKGNKNCTTGFKSSGEQQADKPTMPPLSCNDVCQSLSQFSYFLSLDKLPDVGAAHPGTVCIPYILAPVYLLKHLNLWNDGKASTWGSEFIQGPDEKK